MTKSTLWKDNWDESRPHYDRWWRREDFVVNAWNSYEPDVPHADVVDPGKAPSLEALYTDPHWRAQATRYRLAHAAYPLDLFPLANTDIGPGSLGMLLGAAPEFAEDTVWLNPVIDDPETCGELRFDAGCHWWKVHEAVIRANVEASGGSYFVGSPDFVEGLDTLAALRGSQELMLDLVARGDWVKRKLAEINQALFDAYSLVWEMIKDDDGSACWGAFRLWAPGKVIKTQCDASAMISPAMFREFVVPVLTERCAWFDYSMYHLDGTQAIMHVDALLEIDELDAIEWTPQAGIDEGGSPRWYDLYRRILEAGKSIQAIRVQPGEVAGLLDAVGTRGVYITLASLSRTDALELSRVIEKYR